MKCLATPDVKLALHNILHEDWVTSAVSIDGSCGGRAGAGKQSPAAAQKPLQFPWKPGPAGRVMDGLRNFLLSTEFQQMLQLAAGERF